MNPRWVSVVAPLVLEDVCPVVAHAKTHREAFRVIRGADVPRIRRLAQKCRMIGAAGQVSRARRSVAVIGSDSQTSQSRRQKREMLLVRNLKTGDVCTAGVPGLRNLKSCIWTRSRLCEGQNNRI